MAAPFGATVTGVRALVLDTAAGEGLRPATSRASGRVSDDLVGRWIDEASTRVNLRCSGWQYLDSRTQLELERQFCAIVEFYSASMLAELVYPERAGNTASLADRLLARCETLLDEAAALVGIELQQVRERTAIDPTTGIAVTAGSAIYVGRPPGPLGTTASRNGRPRRWADVGF